jgi:hypothetical protein
MFPADMQYGIHIIQSMFATQQAMEQGCSIFLAHVAHPERHQTKQDLTKIFF